MRDVSVARLLLAGLAALLLLAPGVFAIPQTINYQGLLEEDGVPVDGMRSIVFRIYDASAGGNILWEETQSVTLSGGVFSIMLGSTEPIPASVFDGGRRWLSVSVEGEAEILPRGEIVSVGYAYFAEASDTSSYAETAGQAESALSADQAVDAGLLDGMNSSEFAGVNHSHDQRYYRQTVLSASDGSPPNSGSNMVHWDNLDGMPEGFSDGVDDSGAPGATDHGQLTGLLDNDHPQYPLTDSLRISDQNAPNEGRNMVHWDVLVGVPTGLADGTDDVTTDASDITTGTMSPERVEGVAVVESDERLLTTAERNALTGGGLTTLHSHTEVGDISEVTAGEGLSGGGTSDEVTVSHAEDASSLPFAHHYPPVIAHSQREDFLSGSESVMIIDSLTITVPDTGYVFVSFSLSQRLHLELEGFPPEWRPKRYMGNYGAAVDQSSTIDYGVTSSMQDSIFWAGGLYVPTNSVAGTIARPVSEGTHTIFLLTELVLKMDAAAKNNLEDISLTAIYFPYDSSSIQSAMLLGGGGRRGFESRERQPALSGR
jgi:hypothetical protein